MSKNQEIRTFAQHIIKDHIASSAKLKSLTQSIQGLQIPQQMDTRHFDLVDKLKSASEAQFDQLYRRQQVQAHQQAIQLYQTFASGGDNPELQQFAEATLPALQKHLKMAQALPRDAAGSSVSQVPQGPGKLATQEPGQTAGQQAILTAVGPDHILGSDLRGTTVYSVNDENVGEINEIVLGRDGKVVAVVVGVGGFLGIGEKDVAIPFEAIEIIADGGGSGSSKPQSADPDRVVLRGMTKQQLDDAPTFKN